MNRLDRDFYCVVEDNGKKYIHLWGYCWYCDSDESDTPYRNEEFTFCFLEPGFTEEDYQRAVDSCKHYISDWHENEIINIMDNYFGNEYTALPMRSVTQDTPCGDYIDC